jgi:hypothetical protein
MRFRPIRHRSTAFAILAATVVLSGCVTETWTTKPGPQHVEKLGVTADLPEGWSRFNPDPDLVMTKDGILLQKIWVTRKKYGSKIPRTEQTINQDTEAQEAAQIMIDAMAADQTRQRVTVTDNRPATVGGRPGFRLEVTYQTPEGLTVRETAYVALTDDSYVIVRYSAPNRYYHERDQGAFERVVQSLKIDEPPPAKK